MDRVDPVETLSKKRAEVSYRRMGVCEKIAVKRRAEARRRGEDESFF